MFHLYQKKINKHKRKYLNHTIQNWLTPIKCIFSKLEPKALHKKKTLTQCIALLLTIEIVNT